MELIVQQEKCIGCGACVRDCLRDLLYVEDGKARVKDGICIRCGHCVAVCPADAVRLAGQPEEEILPYDPSSFDIPSAQLLNFMKFRRSIRQFKDKPVEQEKLDLLLEAARYAPTGGNAQKTRYILLDESKDELTELALKTLYDAAERMDSDPTLRGMERYRGKFSTMYPAWKEHGEDGLFYNAPCVLMVVSRYPKAGTGWMPGWPPPTLS